METDQVNEFGWASEWRTEHRCVSCHEALTEHEKFYSYGLCPLCGFKSERAGSLVDTVDVAYRLRRIAPWWMFWKKPERVYRQLENL